MPLVTFPLLLDGPPPRFQQVLKVKADYEIDYYLYNAANEQRALSDISEAALDIRYVEESNAQPIITLTQTTGINLVVDGTNDHIEIKITRDRIVLLKQRMAFGRLVLKDGDGNYGRVADFEYRVLL